MKEHLGARLDAYLDGTLTKKEHDEVAEHLQGCAACKEDWAALKDLAAQLAQAKRTTETAGSFKQYWNRLLDGHKEAKTVSAIQRLKRVVESNVHSAIDAMEEPSKMIRQLLREMELAIEQARAEAVRAIVLEKGLAHRHGETSSKAKKWEERAALALKNEREDLAREALKEQVSLEALAEEFQQEWEKQKARVADLKNSLARLEGQVADLRRRKSLWLSQTEASLRASASRQDYAVAYTELGRMLDITRETSAMATSTSELDAGLRLEETLDEMDQQQVIEQRLVVLKQGQQ